MAVVATNPDPAVPHRKEMTAEHALTIAWWTWCALLVIPCFFFVGTLWYIYVLTREAPAATAAGDRQIWFIIAMAYMVLAVPGAFFWRSHAFRGYWTGRVVSPRNYLIGMMTIWIAFEIGGLLSLLGIWVTGELLPNLLPALVAFMLFVPLWPNGHAMTRPLRNEHDPADYEEPR